MSIIMVLSTLLWTGKIDLAGAIKKHERYGKFIGRAIDAGMPKGFYPHEVSGKVVVAGNLANPAEHVVFVEGKVRAKAPNKEAAKDAYYANRGSENGGRTNAEYVDHFAPGTVDVKKAATKRFSRMNERGINHKARILHTSAPAKKTAKVETKKNTKK